MENNRSTDLTSRKFQANFPTEESCLEHLMRTRYGQRQVCVKCEREARYYRVKARRSYECEHCGYQVYPTAGTPFEKTRTNLRDWFQVMFLFMASRNGVSAKEVQRTIRVTYKTAWRMARLIRSYVGYVDGDTPLGGLEGATVQVEHTLIGGECKMDENEKKVILGMDGPDGNIIARRIPDRKGVDVRAARAANIK